MQQMQEPSLFETNESAQSALQSNSTSKSVLDLGVSSANNSLNFKKGDRQNLCQNSQNTLNLTQSVDFSKELEQLRNNPNYKPQIRYNKKPFSLLIFSSFTSLDFDLFMCFCFAANEKGNLKIKISFDDLNFLMGKVISKNSKRLFKKLDEFCEKAAKVIVKQKKDISNSYTHLFDNIEIFEKEEVIIIQFNALMVSALNNFKFGNFYTQFELQQYCEKLTSKYSKQLYILLMDNLYTEKPLKKYREELIEYLNLKNKVSYKDESNFKKFVLDIACNELQKVFAEFIIKRDYGNGKNNRKVIAYNFIYKK